MQIGGEASNKVIEGGLTGRSRGSGQGGLAGLDGK